MKLKKKVIMDHINKVPERTYIRLLLNILIEQGRAYPCFATPEELDEMRKKTRSS